MASDEVRQSHIDLLQDERGHSNSMSLEEVREAFTKMKRGKTCAETGLVAEMLQHAQASVLRLLAEAFSDTLQGRLELPESWCMSKMVVLFKKGDPTLAKNYRPIAIAPVLSKRFSTIILNRLKGRLDRLQGPEQAGFRPD